MKRMTEVKNVPAWPQVGDVRVRVDLSKIGAEFGPVAIKARGNRREYLGGAVVVEAFNVRDADPEKTGAGES